MQITIVLELHEESWADPQHETGLTNHGYEEVMSIVSDIGDIVDIRAGGK